MCGGSSCGGLPSAGTIQPRGSPHGCFLRVITASTPLWPRPWPNGVWKGGGKPRNSNGQGGIRPSDTVAGIPAFETARYEVPVSRDFHFDIPGSNPVCTNMPPANPLQTYGDT